MKANEYNDPKKSLVLFGLENKLDFLIKLYNSKKLPRVLMISGKKGVGKFTLVNHFLSYIYDKDNYDLKNKSINNKTQFYKQKSPRRSGRMILDYGQLKPTKAMK